MISWVIGRQRYTFEANFCICHALIFHSYLGISSDGPKMSAADSPADLMQLAGDAPQSPEDAMANSAAIVCRALPGLVAQQVEVCQHFPDTIQSVSLVSHCINCF